MVNGIVNLWHQEKFYSKIHYIKCGIQERMQMVFNK